MQKRREISGFDLRRASWLSTSHFNEQLNYLGLSGYLNKMDCHLVINILPSSRILKNELLLSHHFRRLDEK